MSNLTTNHDIINDALFRAGEPVDSSSDFYVQAVSDYNRVHQSMCSGGSELLPDANENWWWMRKASPGVITLQPSFNGTAAVVNNSANVTLSATYATSLAKAFFYAPNSGGDIYRVLSHVAGTAAVVLDSVWTDVTNAALTVRAVQLEYDLASDVHAIFGAMKGNRSGIYRVDGCELEQLEDEYPVQLLSAGQPKLFAMVGEQRVRFSHYPGDLVTDLLRLEYDYKVVATDLADDANTPLVPREYRRLLSDFLLYFIYMSKNDDRATQVLNTAQAGLMAMVKENRKRLMKMGAMFGALIPRQDQLNTFRRTPRTTSGLLLPL